MTKHTKSQWFTEDSQRIEHEHQLLEMLREVSSAARDKGDRAYAAGHKAVARLAELDSRLSAIIKQVREPERDKQELRSRLLRMMARIDQTDATANEIIRSDVGDDIDLLAERICQLAEEMNTNITCLLENAEQR